MEKTVFKKKMIKGSVAIISKEMIRETGRETYTLYPQKIKEKSGYYMVHQCHLWVCVCFQKKCRQGLQGMFVHPRS